MRIISGKFKGRQLVGFQASHIRPTTDRVKETLFNKLMGRVDGARVLDLFSGTGNLALEAISRGAAWVDLVENHKKSLAIIRENFTKLGIDSGFKIHSIDAFRYISEYRGAPYDIVIADPPFTQALAHDLAAAIAVSNLLAPDSMAVIEASSKERVDDDYAGIIHLDRRQFGDKQLLFFQKDVNGQGNLPR